MTTLLAEYALSGAMLTAMAVLLACIAFVKTSNDGLLRFARLGQTFTALLLSISSFGLLKALLDDNFSLAYVSKHSEKALAPGFKAAAFWAGQEGSLLFWALLLALMGLVMTFRARNQNTSETAIATATMAAATGFFTCVMLFAGNPFDRATGPVHNGEGLNPMLQNLAMVFHPPMLFLGYAGFTAPFALMLGALLSGRKDASWLTLARPWIIFSWIALTVGIVLGAQWAYMELGWGGYWAWDPVENASLLPWLTGTALLHSVLLYTRRGIFKRWTASLIAASFFLCVLGTYLTRSGIIQSVHSFGESPIGTFFLVFLIAIGIVSVGVILFRLHLLEAEHPLEDLFSREGFFLCANVLLSLMTLITLIGTIFPVISGWFTTTPVTVGAPFYNKVILPMALLLAAMMATGPILGSGAGAAFRARVRLFILAAVGLLAALVTALLGFTSPWALAAAFTVAAILTGISLDIIQSIRARPANSNLLSATIRTFTSRPRHWGAQLAHLGLAAIVAGITASSVYGNSQNFELKPTGGPEGKPTVARLGHYTLSATSLEQLRRDNHTAIAARILVQPDNAPAFTLQPERRFYDQGMGDGQSYANVALRFSLASDLYITLAGWEDNGSVITISAILNPLVSWIWIGGGLLTLGGIVCLIPTGKRQPVPAATPVEEPAAPPAPTGQTARERRRARQLQPATTARN